MTIAWGQQLAGQLEFYWNVHLRPRLDGLTDEEYFWEPVEGAWTVRGNASGGFVADSAWPEPDPSPFTTIAWRLSHIAIGCFADRANLFFDASVPTETFPGTAAGALKYLDEAYDAWFGRISALTEDEMALPLGEKGGPFSEEPMGALVIHINREVMHHGGEIGVLRDLYRDRARWTG